MNYPSSAARDPWYVARFPSRALREEFLEQIRLRNRLEDLPKIPTEPMCDGLRVRFRVYSWGEEGMLNLIESRGGWLASRPA